MGTQKKHLDESSFEHPKHLFKLMDKKIITVLIDHEIVSTDTLLPSADPFKKGFCQLQAKVCARSTG